MPLTFPGRWFWPGVALAVGIAGICAIWVAIAMLSGSSASWLGLVAAVDMALLLRLTRAPEGIARNVAAALATLAATALSQWLVVATQLGIALGLPPLSSALRLGPHLAWMLAGMTLSPVDWVLLAAGPILAALLVQAVGVPRAADASPADGASAPRRAP
jgi:hypothetical protein